MFPASDMAHNFLSHLDFGLAFTHDLLNQEFKKLGLGGAGLWKLAPEWLFSLKNQNLKTWVFFLVIRIPSKSAK